MVFWVWDLAMLIEIFVTHTFCDEQISEGLSENTFNGLQLIPIVVFADWFLFYKDFTLQVLCCYSCARMNRYISQYISQRYT